MKFKFDEVTSRDIHISGILPKMSDQRSDIEWLDEIG